MTIDEMRLLLALGPEVPDATVVQAYAEHLDADSGIPATPAPIVTLDEVKLFLRVTQDDEDAIIELLIGAATETALRLAD